MKKLLLAFLTTIAITMLFFISGKTLITMFLILSIELYTIFHEYKSNKNSKEIEIIKEEPQKNKTYSMNKIIKPSYTKCKHKVKMKVLEHKR